MPPESPVVNVVLSAVVATFAIAAVVAIVFLMHRQARRRRALRSLHRGADGLEHDLKECRARLERAHAAMTVAPELPAAGETDAHAAIDAALRELLAHRLWLRDSADDANQRELDAAVFAIGKARESLSQQLDALASAQHALDAAVRERIEDIAQR
ncbi:MAG: hypothetical protein ABIY40_06635 [Rhodanobacteraceae bacterium]